VPNKGLFKLSFVDFQCARTPYPPRPPRTCSPYPHHSRRTQESIQHRRRPFCLVLYGLVIPCRPPPLTIPGFTTKHTITILHLLNHDSMHMIHKASDGSEEFAAGVSVDVEVGLFEQGVARGGFAFEVDGLAACVPSCISIVQSMGE
jgi:hypothetical protein